MVVSGILFVITLAQAYVKEGPVFELMGKDYDKFLKEFRTDLRVILFYSPFGIQGFSPSGEFLMAAKGFPEKSTKFAKVNFFESFNEGVRKRYEISSPPFIIYYLAGTDKYVTYHLEVKASQIIDFMAGKLYQVKGFNSTEELDDLMTNEFRFKSLAIGVFEQFSGTKFEIFKNFTYFYKDKYDFALVKDEGQWGLKFNLTADSVVVCHGSGIVPDIHEYVSLTNYKTSIDLKQFVSWAWDPFVTFINKKNMREFNTTEVPLVVFYLNFEKFYNEIPAIVSKLYQVFESKIPKFLNQKKYQFAIAEVKEFETDLNALGLSGFEVICLMYFRGDVYKVSQECFFDGYFFDSECISDFVKDYELGDYKKYFRSEPPPEVEYENGIRKATRDTLPILSEDKDFVKAILFYTEGSTEFKNYMKVYEELASLYRVDSRIEFLKYDIVKNSVPANFEVPYPNFLYFTTRRGNRIYQSRFLLDMVQSYLDDLLLDLHKFP